MTMKYVISPNDVEPIQLIGREMRRLITSQTVGAEKLSVGVIWVPPGEEVLPCHSHEAEEALYIVRGEGQSWIEGQVEDFKTGEIVYFPWNCRHFIRNTGKEVLQAVCIFSPPMPPEKYTLHKEIRFHS